MEEAPSRDDAPNTSRDVSGVLNASSYSLRDISDSESFAKADDAELLDESVLALLDKPYSQLQDRMHLRRQDQYDGFDNSTGSSWIYPTNYPVRQYQFTITKAALFKNTLVVLPTGLGKTFIAAVVMYNIYRWYPTGKVIFMAPTRPLVAQQIDACYRIMGIPRKDTAEITGKQQRKSRAELWQTKRVFYVTPQVVQADLCAPAQAFPVEQVRLVVIDEAHKAKGRYAYTEVIRMIAARNKHFRVLALSATPGRTLQDVAEVIQNLLISHIEVRWENSIDVSPYTFRRKLRTIVIPLGETIRTIRTELQQLVNPYMQRLCDANVLYCGNPALMTRGMLIMEQKRFRENSLLCRHPQHSTVNADFGVCVSMFHAIDLLVRHGIRALLNFFADGGEGASEKYFVAKDPLIKQFLERLRERYGGRNDGLDVPNGAAALPTTGDDDVEFGHPKFRILEEQLSTHFADHPDSKAIVFCEFRDSVAMIHRLLSQRAPLIRPKCIVGQGGTSGIRAVTQKEQIAAMKQFRDGVCNTLIATCVAEEGIDVGEVDLIVCFDITKNPTRFVQRIGRTGRQRVGRVLMLVTGGEEHDTLKRVLASKDRTNQQLARSKDIMRSLYRHSPRLVPAEFEPQCVEMFITIEQEDGAQGNAASGAGKRTSTKREHDIEEASKRRKVAGASTTTTSPKGTQDLRRFFQRPRARFPADGELDASERDVFSFVDQQPAERRPKQPDHTVSRPHTTPVDRCIRPGRSDQELAIERRVRPLVCHYELLKKQNFIHRQQLLDVPTVEQIRQRRKLAIIRSEVARQLLGPPRNAPCDTDQVVKIDDPFDLPSLRALPESYRFHCRASDDSPRFRTCASPPDVPPPVPPSPVIEAFTSNMFDSTLNLSDLEHTGNLGANRVTTGWESTTTVPSSANRKRTAPVDSPLMRAFDRSMRKRRLDDGRSAPVGTSHAKSHTSTASSVPAPETPPLTAQVASRRKLAEGAVPGRTPTVDSPLMRAFHRSVQKRSNSNGGQQGGADSILQRQMVLEFFKLDSLEQIFDDDSEEEPLRKDNTVTLVEARNDTNAGSSIQSTSVIDVSPEKQSEPEKESAPSGEEAEPTDRGESSRCISRKTSRFPALPDPDQENRSSSKNFNLGSPVLVLDESDDDLFGSLDSKKNEPTVVVPLERKEEELKNQRKQRTPTAKPILVERQQQEQPVGHGSHFEMIQKSPSVFAKRPRVASKSRLAPTKLNFSRLYPDQNRQLPSAPENNDVLPRPSPPVERTSSAFFNTCDSQMMSSPTSSAHRSSSKNFSLGLPVLVLDESDDDLFGLLDSKKNEPTVVVPLEQKEEELTNVRKQRTPTAKSILVEAQQQEHPVGHGSHFEMIQKSPSVFAKRPRVASKSRLAPTTLNFSRLCPDQNRQLPSAPENNDVLPRPSPPVERTSSAFFNTCDSQMMSSRTSSAHRSSSKNFSLGSPVLVLDESDDDLFGLLDSKKNEPPVVVPLEQKEEELTNQRKQRTPTAKSILVEAQQQEHPVGHGSHFEMIQKSPSVFAKRPRVASKSRLAPTKLNFSRLCPDPNRQLPSAPENNDVLPRPSPPVERALSAFFNTCDSQMMSSPTSSAHRSSSKNLSRGAPVLVLDESDDDLFVSLDSKKNEPTVVVPLERKEEELKNQRKQRTPTAKSILVERQQQEQPVGHGSHFEMIKKSTSVFAKRPRVASKSRLAPTKLNFSRQCPDQNRQLPSAAENNDVLPRPSPPVERTSSAFFNTCDSQMMSSPTASPLQPEADRAMDLNESTVIGHRLMRGRPMHHPITSNLESEDEAENVGSLTAGRLLTATMKEKLNDDDSDDIFEKGKSRSSCIRPNRKSTELPQTRPMMPSTSLATATRQNKRKKARATARCFFDSQAAVSGSEEEDEDEPNEWMGMDSFIDPGGSQSSQADATCVDMRAVYLQSVRSPMVARGGFKIPASRLFTEHDHSSPHPSMDLVDNDDEDDDGEHFENTSGKPDDVREEQEAMESSFINDEVVVEIDSELSELEQAELVLRERRRAAKRKRQQRTESERTNTKRRRRIIILSDSE